MPCEQLPIKELAHLIGLSQSAIQKNITVLKSSGVLFRRGPDKGGYWQVVEGKNEV